jgi:hypothetical protein
VGPVIGFAISRTLLPAVLCTCHTRLMGLPILLLVSIRLGDCRLSPFRHRLQQTQKLIRKSLIYAECGQIITDAVFCDRGKWQRARRRSDALLKANCFQN